MTFTIQYGAGVGKIAAGLKYGKGDGTGAVHPDQLRAILGRDGTYDELGTYLRDRWRQGLPTATQFIRKLTKDIEKRRPQPWVTNKFGRRIPVEPGYEYKALNYLIQGTAADLMKQAMIRSWAAALQFCAAHSLRPWVDVQLFMTIHDELVWKVPAGMSEALARAIEPAMCTWEQFRLPIRVSFARCDAAGSWATKKDFTLPPLSSATVLG